MLSHPVADDAVRATIGDDEVVFSGSDAVMDAMKKAGVLADTAKTYVELPVMRVIMGLPGELRVLADMMAAHKQAVGGDTAETAGDAAPAQAATAGAPSAAAQEEANLLDQ
jgi:hypothetical protein